MDKFFRKKMNRLNNSAPTFKRVSKSSIQFVKEKEDVVQRLTIECCTKVVINN
jgi:hypothetical protein